MLRLRVVKEVPMFCAHCLLVREPEKEA